MRGILASSGGFTFVGALMIVILMGIMLGIVGQSWQMVMKREREEELLFRGNQYRIALEQWHTPTRSGGGAPRPLNDLKDLLKDPQSARRQKYLRRLYKDPITGEDFATIVQPGKGIVGVMSTSDKEPLKKTNFPDELATFENQDQYKKWVFTIGAPAGQQNQGARTQATTPSRLPIQ
ncbi:MULTISPECIES: type II secretion system protein [Geobacter]|uniref:Type II secretion system pseudopilin TklG n=2 Tax=Geobacter TaxID=28231 RepID=A0A0C1QYL9_9BACT|nr:MULTISPECIES: type II secretion system protein [Geobacter]KIE43276.1 type II secretion system pseudopilin TklG [Geobacter soli]MBE2889031.1 type II secretion system protein [Geobacter anodireducens]HMN02927.1 type II secretion system protein [Geobacter anodireducens]